MGKRRLLKRGKEGVEEKETEIKVEVLGSPSKCFKCGKPPVFVVHCWLGSFECKEHYACERHKRGLLQKFNEGFFSEIGWRRLELIEVGQK